MSNSHGAKSRLDLRTNLFQQRENNTGVSLCVLISNFMYLAQVFQVEEDLKIAWKTNHHVTCDASNNEISNSRANEDSIQDVTWDTSQDVFLYARNNISWRAKNLFA